MLIGINTLTICSGQSDSVMFKLRKKVVISSKVLNENREIWISLPLSYNNQAIQKKVYPVLYLLDGDTHFYLIDGLLKALSGGNNGTYATPEMILVAILNTNRLRDLTPSHSMKGLDGGTKQHLKISGGGNNFLTFVSQELIAHVDSAYRTTNFRVFVGHSLGGLMVMQALQSFPGKFNAYVAIDPSLWWDSQRLVRQGENYFKRTDLSKKQLFLAQANTLSAQDTAVNVHYESIKMMEMLLETRNLSGLNWKYQFYPDDNHNSVVPHAAYEALRFIFKDYQANSIRSAADLRKHYQDFSLKTGSNFLPEEDLVNQFASNAMTKNNLELAKAYLQMNIDLYPKSSQAHEELGKWFIRTGNKQKALAFYEKAAELNTSNAYLKKLISDLQVTSQ